MANPRRVAWLLVAAQVGVASITYTQSAQAQARPAPTAADDEEDEEDPPSTSANTNGGAANNTAANTAATSTPPAGETPPAAASNNRGHTDFPQSDESETDRDARRERMLPRFSGIDGSIGLVHLSTAEAGSEQTFRFGLLAEYFGTQGFLRPTNNANHPLTTVPDDTSRIGATLTASYSPLRYLEIFTALKSFATSNNREVPTLFQVLGDAQLGAKGVFPITRGFTIGASVAAIFLNRAGGIGLNGDGTSANFRLLSTFDLSQVTSAPIRFHLNLGYQLDNSAQLVRDTEVRRQMAQPGYDATACNNPRLPNGDPNPAWVNNPACHAEITRGERFALGINRADRFNIGIGVDARLNTSVIGFQPFLEWNVPLPVIRSGYLCWLPGTTQSPIPMDDDQCYDGGAPFAAIPSNLTLGTRVWTPYARGLAGILAFDIATGGSGQFVRVLAPNQPWNLYFGLSFAHDFHPRVERISVERIVERVVERDNTPHGGEFVGVITDQETHQPIAHARVEIQGHPEFGIAATDAQGRYRTRRIAPGDYQVHVHMTDYTDNNCPANMPAPTGDSRTTPDTTVNCEIRIAARHGIVAGRVSSNGGAPAAGVVVTLTPQAGITVPQGQSAPAPVTATTGADGTFRFENVLAGTWSIRADHSNTTRASTARSVDVVVRQTAAADIQVANVDDTGISIRGRLVNIAEQVHFENDAATILPDSQVLLERIADFLNRHPELQAIEVQGHTDNRGQRPRNVALSQQRAQAVVTALTNLGVAADRLTARGFGPDRPIAPNLTDAGRARNRRVMFEIKRRGR